MNLLRYYLDWHNSPHLRTAFVIVSASLLVTLWHPGLWPWAAGLVGLNHLYLTVAGLWPRSQVIGANWISLPAPAARRGEIAITIDDGPDPRVTPQVLEILERFQAKATFFCIGAHAERYPELCREIIRRGHAIENHTQRHSVLFSFFGPFRARREIQDAQAALSRITGQAPCFFRPPAGLRNPLLHPVLVHLGLRQVSWSRRGFDTRQTDPEVVLQKLARDLKGGDILLLHDGNAARTRGGIPVILHVLPRLLEITARARLRAVTLRSAAQISAGENPPEPASLA